MDLITQAHLPTFKPVFSALDSAKQTQKILKFNAYKSIDQAIENLQNQRGEASDKVSINRQIKELKSLKKLVEKSDLKDSESVNKLTRKIIRKLDTNIDNDSLTFFKSCSIAFDTQIKSAKTHLKEIQKDYKATAPKQGMVRRLTAAFGKILRMLGKPANRSSLSYIEKSASKLEYLVRKQTETPLSKRDLQAFADAANRNNLLLLKDGLALLEKYPHGGPYGEINSFMVNLNLAIDQVKRTLDAYPGKDSSQPAKDLKKHISILEEVKALDPEIKSTGEIQRGLVSAILQMGTLQGHVQKNLGTPHRSHEGVRDIQQDSSEKILATEQSEPEPLSPKAAALVQLDAAFKAAQEIPDQEERYQAFQQVYSDARDLKELFDSPDYSDNPVTEQDYIQVVNIMARSLHEIHFNEALNGIATIRKTLDSAPNGQIDVRELDDIQKKLDDIRVILANVPQKESPQMAQQLKAAKLESADLNARISELREQSMTAGEVIDEFVAKFLHPYLSGQIDPAKEKPRPTMLAQLEAHIIERGRNMDRAELASHAAQQFVIEGLRSLASQLGAEAYQDADRRSVAAHRELGLNRPYITHSSPIVIQYRDLLGHALKREFAPIVFSSHEIDRMLSHALTLMPGNDV